MTGKHTIIVQAKRVKFELTVERNITIIKGDSATGKTTLVGMIKDFNIWGASFGVNVICDKKCKVIEGTEWKKALSEVTDSIVFIDEGNDFIATKEFANIIQKTDNYYVIISRVVLPMLPYSVNSVFELKVSNKFFNVKQVYNVATNLYIGAATERDVTPSLIITEDSKAGGQFFSNLGVKCIHAGGKSKIFGLIQELSTYTDGEVLIVADGAAFGPEIDDIIEELKVHKKFSLYTPESFEWLLLKADLFENGNKIKEVLSKPYNYIESSQFFSWERFFTSFLVRLTDQLDRNNTMVGYKYPSNKAKLPAVYLSDRIKNKVLAVLPGNIKIKH